MATSGHSSVAGALQSKIRGVGIELVLRFCLVPVAVVLCYQFHWDWLRSLTATANLKLTSLFGVHWVRVGPDLVNNGRQLLHFTIACTLADAWCGAIPLVWKITGRILENVAYLGALAGFLFALNIVRLTVSNLLVSAGVPWILGHECVSGLTYLVPWLLILHRAAWRRTAVPT